MATIVDPAAAAGSHMRYQSFIPHTSKVFNQQIARETAGGLNEVHVATFKRVFGEHCFRAPCSCPRCPKK